MHGCEDAGTGGTRKKDDKEMRFKCSKCGECCRHIGGVHPMSGLDRGDGVCKHLTDEGLCEVYESRPLICRVDDSYGAFPEFKTKREYYDYMYSFCEMLMQMKQEREEKEG